MEKNRNLMPIFKSFFWVVLIAGCQVVPEQYEPSDGWQSKVDGTYTGIIVSGGIETPVTTNILKSKIGIFNGDYEFIDNGTAVTGTLYDCQVISSLKLKCNWRDLYGTGDLLISFNDLVTEFDGLWNSHGGEKKYPWNGAK